MDEIIKMLQEEPTILTLTIVFATQLVFFVAFFLREIVFRNKVKKRKIKEYKTFSKKLERSVLDRISEYNKELIDNYTINFRVSEAVLDELRKEFSTANRTSSLGYEYNLLHAVNRLTVSQRQIQEEFEKMTLLLSATGVHSNSSASQEGIDAVKLLKQISEMTNIDYLLSLMQDQRENKFIVMNNVISDMYHTIKTPLTGMHAIVTLLRDGSITDSNILARIGEMEKSLIQIEDNLQAYRYLMTNNLDEQTTSEMPFTERLTARLKLAALSSNKRLYIDSRNVEELEVDNDTAKLILLALDCIIENAAYFAKDNSTIRVSGHSDDEVYTFQIENDGQIIDESIAKRIFENGFSSHSSSGKGLFIVHSAISERLGGEIDFENIIEPESGVRFLIMLDKSKLLKKERVQDGESFDS